MLWNNLILEGNVILLIILITMPKCLLCSSKMLEGDHDFHGNAFAILVGN